MGLTLAGYTSLQKVNAFVTMGDKVGGQNPVYPISVCSNSRWRLFLFLSQRVVVEYAKRHHYEIVF